MEREEAAERSDELRKHTIGLCARIEEARNRLGLGGLDGLAANVEQLVRNEYSVLVCGEIKRGKSSFINGLLGDSVLPVGIEVATCQAFSIKCGAEEGYWIRLSDGSRRRISRDELGVYGSQANIDDRGGAVRGGGSAVDRIEVEYPAKLLPHNVELVDTPGLGALYAQHAEITERFVRDADAIVFVCDSSAPVKKSEVGFLRRIARRCPHVLVVQTKIDAYEDDADNGSGRVVASWQAVQRRNEEILRAEVGSLISRPIHVWPVSNVHVAKAAAAGEGERGLRLMRVSRFADMLNELERFLFYVAGWARSAQVVYEVSGFWHQQEQILRKRREALELENAEALRQLRAEMEARANDVQAAWRVDGALRSQADATIRKVVKGAGRQFQQLTGSSGNVYQAIECELDQLTSVRQCKAFERRVAELVAETFFAEVGDIVDTVEATIGEEARKLVAAMDEVSPYGGDVGRTELDRYLRTAVEARRTGLRPPQGGFWYGLRNGVAEVISLLAKAFSIPMLLSKLGDIFRSPEEKVYRYKVQVLAEVRRALGDVHAAAWSVDIRQGRTDGAFEKYLGDQVSAWDEFAERIRGAKKAQFDGEMARLRQQVEERDRAKRSGRVEEAMRAYTEWVSMRGEIEALVEEIRKLDGARASAGTF